MDLGPIDPDSAGNGGGGPDLPQSYVYDVNPKARLPALSPQIDLAEVRVFVKASRLEREMVKAGSVSRDDFLFQLRQRHCVSDEDIRALVRNHNLVDGARKMVGGFFKPSQVLHWDDLHGAVVNGTVDEMRSALSSVPVVLVLGGDESLKFIQHFLTHPNHLVIGITLDTFSSKGNLNQHSLADLNMIYEGLEQGAYEIFEWQRLGIRVKGKELGPFLSEATIQSTDSNWTSAMRVWINDDESSARSLRGGGLLVATGNGVRPGSWYDNVTHHWKDEYKVPTFPPDSSVIRWMMRDTQIHDRACMMGDVQPGEVLNIRWGRENPARINADKHFPHEADPCAILNPSTDDRQVAISLHPSPLRVARVIAGEGQHRV